MQPLDDVKTAFKHWTKNVMAFIITMIGAALILGIILVVLAIPVAFILAFSSSTDLIQQLISLAQFWYPILHGNIEIVLNTDFLIILLPIIMVYSWIFGSIYRLCNDVVNSRTPTVGGPFIWLRENPLVSLGSGVILGGLSIGPILLLSIILGSPIVYPLDWAFGIITSVWYFLIIGITGAFIPALIDDNGIIQALKKSVVLFKNKTRRILGIEFVFLIMFGIMFGPLPVYSVISGSFDPSTDIMAAFILSVSALGLFIMGFVLLPVFYLTMTRLYEECKNSC